MKESRISIVVAIGRDHQHNRVIGCKNELLWHIPEDLKRFKAITLGHPIIMGRKTWESLPEKVRPLPGRTNIVVTRDSTYEAPGAQIAHSFPEALSYAKNAPGSEEIFIGGGTELYQASLPFVSRLYLTLIDDEQDGDAYFPAYEEEFTHVVSDEHHSFEDLTYRWITVERP